MLEPKVSVGKVEWRDIPGYEGVYQANVYGEIRSLPRNTAKDRILKQRVNNTNGYCYVSLSKKGEIKSVRVHVAVMNAFRPIEKKSGYDKSHTINHIDGDKTNNNLSNLEWCTQSENQKKAIAIGLQTNSGVAVINIDTGAEYKSLTEAARAVGGTIGEMVARVCRGERSHYRGNHFAFKCDYLKGTIPKFKGRNERKASERLWR